MRGREVGQTFTDVSKKKKAPAGVVDGATEADLGFPRIWSHTSSSLRSPEPASHAKQRSAREEARHQGGARRRSGAAGRRSSRAKASIRRPLV